ncbi:MAG: hypothetical protein HOQ03_13280 [Thermoleophilia bacterium]|nr:hypothetical protein [Thermoleophilia bacterium]
MRPRTLLDGASIASVTLVLGWVLSLATTRVKNWFVMTDELYYERLAVSVAQTGSLLPRIHGELVPNVNQLYPLVLSTVYGDGDVQASFAAAHRLNAFVIATAAIPVYLLARRLELGRPLSLWVAALSVAVPWIVLASFLLTEVVAYPMFCWGLLAITYAVERKRWTTDLLTLAVIGVAVVSRTQFVVLLAVLFAAVVVDAVLDTSWRAAPRELWRTRRPLSLFYALVALVVLAGIVVNRGSRLLGSYSVAAENVRIDFGLVQLWFEHLAVLALGLAILPFAVGAAWLLEHLRPSAEPRRRAFAAVGVAAFVLVVLEVASFNQRFGAGLVKDRYLFYVVPVVLLGLAGAVSARQWPRWWALAAPAAAAAIGFVSMPVAPYEKLNVDSIVAMLNGRLLDLATTTRWAHVLLVLATLVALQALLLARAFVPWRPVAAAVAAVASLALPLEAVYAFDRLFAVDGTNGLPVTLDQGGVFGWIDRNVGAGARVTAVKYPVGGADWWAGQGYWWDVEFWNETAVRTMADMSRPSTPPWPDLFDRRTGRAHETPDTRYAIFHGTDVRFRLAGIQRAFDRGAYIVEPERPWRADWVTRGIWPDGWTRPHAPATITVFAKPGQTTPLRRFLTIEASGAEAVDLRPVTFRSSLGTWRGTIAPEMSVGRVVAVCVPPGGSARVTISAPGASGLYRDPTVGPPTGISDRPVGILLRTVALADETQAMKRCPT